MTTARPSTAASPTAPSAAAVLDALGDLVLLADHAGDITWSSPSVEEVLGWRADQLIARPITDLVADGPDHDVEVDELRDALTTPGGRRPGRCTFVTADGDRVRIEHVTTNRLGSGDLDAVVLAGRVLADGDPWADEVVAEPWAAALLRATSDLIFGVLRDGTITYASPSSRDVLGRSPRDLTGKALADLVHSRDRPLLQTMLGDGHTHRQPAVLRFEHVDGTLRHVRTELAAVRGGSDVVDRIGDLVVTGTDVTERRQVQDLLADQASVLERIARGAPLDETLDAVARLLSHRLDQVGVVIGYGDQRGGWHDRTLNVSREVVAVLDRTAVIRPHVSEGGFDGRLPRTILRSPGWSAVVRAATGSSAQGCWALDLVTGPGRVIGRLVVLLTEDRPATPAEAELVDRAGDLVTIAVERQGMQERMERQALHDDLTGMANRHLLMQAIEAASLANPEGSVGLLFCDLDRFKLINDSLGHEAGDRLLVEVANRFRRGVRPGDLVARMGGDEFVVLCPGVDSEEVILRVADRLAMMLTEPIDLPGTRVVVSASIGVVCASGPVTDPSMLLRDADLAMYEAKQEGRGRHAVFRPELRSQAVERLELENALRVALRADEMQLEYQPIVSLVDGSLKGYEALLRWHRPGVGIVGPNDFIPVATETGLIVDIGRWVIQEAVAEAARWTDTPVAVNLAARQLVDPDLVDFVALQLAEHDLPAGRLCLEVTESDLMADPQTSGDVLRQLKELGVRLAIDDFGTGFATLDYVRRFAFADILKIDGSFIAGIAEPKSRDKAIVEASLVLARTLGFETVAEGVETEEQRLQLVELKCELAQGHLFSKPVPAEMLPGRAPVEPVED